MRLTDIVVQLINMSLMAGVAILLVLFVRQFLKHAPKLFSYLLWAVVLLRLLCPVSISSPVSVYNLFGNGVLVGSSEAGSEPDEGVKAVDGVKKGSTGENLTNGQVSQPGQEEQAEYIPGQQGQEGQLGQPAEASGQVTQPIKPAEASGQTSQPEQPADQTGQVGQPVQSAELLGQTGQLEQPAEASEKTGQSGQVDQSEQSADQTGQVGQPVQSAELLGQTGQLEQSAEASEKTGQSGQTNQLGQPEESSGLMGQPLQSAEPSGQTVQQEQLGNQINGDSHVVDEVTGKALLSNQQDERMNQADTIEQTESGILAWLTDGGTLLVLSEQSLRILTALWLCGVGAVLGYSTIMLIRLQKRLVGAVRLRENIYLADHIETPFVLGVFRPRIYLPSALYQENNCLQYILLHEQTHIRRGDHIVKLLAFLALTLHWFNPLVWVAFFCAGRDMEMACDETVIKKMERSETGFTTLPGQGTENEQTAALSVRAAYSESLLSLSTGRRIFAGTPLAFGEGDPKKRIKNVMNYKKPAIWVVSAAVAVVAVVAIILIGNPKSPVSVDNPTSPTPGGTSPEQQGTESNSVDDKHYFGSTSGRNTFGLLTLSKYNPTAKAESIQVEAELERVRMDDFSPALLDIVDEEWQKYHESDAETRFQTNWQPGECSRSFASWEECMEFLGVDIYNPLEGSTWLQPEGDHPYVVNWRGVSPGILTRFEVTGSYIDGDVRVKINISYYCGSGEVYQQENFLNQSTTFRATFQSMKNGNLATVVMPDSGTDSSSLIFYVENNAIYRIDTLVQPEEQAEMEATVSRILEMDSQGLYQQDNALNGEYRIEKIHYMSPEQLYVGNEPDRYHYHIFGKAFITEYSPEEVYFTYDTVNWAWEDLSYTDDEWNSLFPYGTPEVVRNINSRYSERKLLCVTENPSAGEKQYLLKLDGGLWLIKMDTSKRITQLSALVRTDNPLAADEFSTEVIYPAIMLDDALLFASDTVSTDKNFDETDYEGRINTSVSADTYPAQNGEANFEVKGAPYVKTEDGDAYYVRVGGQWMVYEKEPVSFTAENREELLLEIERLRQIKGRGVYYKVSDGYLLAPGFDTDVYRILIQPGRVMDGQHRNMEINITNIRTGQEVNQILDALPLRWLSSKKIFFDDCNFDGVLDLWFESNMLTGWEMDNGYYIWSPDTLKWEFVAVDGRHIFINQEDKTLFRDFTPTKGEAIAIYRWGEKGFYSWASMSLDPYQEQIIYDQTGSTTVGDIPVNISVENEHGVIQASKSMVWTAEEYQLRYRESELYDYLMQQVEELGGKTVIVYNEKEEVLFEDVRGLEAADELGAVTNMEYIRIILAEHGID